jgi:putative glycosyltransferase DUF6716
MMMSTLAEVSLKVLAVAETDSYLKWAVSLLAQLPAGTQTDVVIASSPVRPSPAQQLAALGGTNLAGTTPPVVSPSRLIRQLRHDRPDAVLLACAGPTAHSYQLAVAGAFPGRGPRPVLLAGVPGIALPARPRAWTYRGGIDEFVVHSHREAQEYERTRALTGKHGRIGLATIPFLAPLPPVTENYVSEDPPSGMFRVTPLRENESRGVRALFATQAKVPQARAEREAILLSLDRLARARPDLRVVVKTRGLPGEFHTHHEAHHYGNLWRRLVASGQVPDGDSLEFAAGSMAEQLAHAAALVTVSSTAVLEAMALEIPVLLIDEFGISADLINEVFVGSGCLGPLSALEAADFRRPQERWLAENYFHPAADNTWVPLLEELVTAAQEGKLAPIADGLGRDRSTLRRWRDRLRLTPAGGLIVRAQQRTRAKG